MHYHDLLQLNERERELYATLSPPDRQTPEAIYPEYYIIKVPAFDKRVKDKIDEWVYFLKFGRIELGFNAQGIQSAAEKLDILSLDEKGRRAYKAYEERLHSDASFVTEQKLTMAIEKRKAKEREEKAAAKGEARGIEIGVEIARRNIAITLKKAALTDEEIALHTGISLEEIISLS